MPVANYSKLMQNDGTVLFVAQADLQVAAQPTGLVQMYAGATTPANWLLCDGASYLRTLYQALFDIIGTTWGAADGTHFNVPDLRGRSPVGVGTGTGLTARALAATGGEESHILSVAELASHAHTSAAHTHSIAMFSGIATAISARASPDHTGTAGSAAETTGSTTPPNTGSNGSGTAHNTMHPFAALNFIIKT